MTILGWWRTALVGLIVALCMTGCGQGLKEHVLALPMPDDFHLAYSSETGSSPLFSQRASAGATYYSALEWEQACEQFEAHIAGLEGETRGGRGSHDCLYLSVSVPGYSPPVSVSIGRYLFEEPRQVDLERVPINEINTTILVNG